MRNATGLIVNGDIIIARASSDYDDDVMGNVYWVSPLDDHGKVTGTMTTKTISEDQLNAAYGIVVGSVVRYKPRDVEPIRTGVVTRLYKLGNGERSKNRCEVNWYESGTTNPQWSSCVDVNKLQK